MVEHKGFEPLTSSMPWKRASQLRQCPKCLVPDYHTKKTPPFEEGATFCCCAPTRGGDIFVVFVSATLGEPALN